MREKGDKPANEIGTLYHLIMSELDMELVRREGADCVEAELERLTKSGRISSEDLRYIETEKIKRFIESGLCRRMLASDELRREAPFQINIPVSEYDPSITDSSGDTVILQGIIDCFFMENGGYVLVDYKTDKIGKGGAEQIRRRYEKQLELYERAIESLTGKKVKEKLLYLFDSGETV